MRFVQIGDRDTAGSGFSLAHAINKLTRHKAVNIRFISDYMRYPTMIEGGAYSREDIRKMVYKADVVHFHIHVKPLFTSLRLNPKKFRDKTTLVYYHGSMLRNFKDDLRREANEYLPNHIVTVSTPDLLSLVKNSVWLPVCRSFHEIAAKYSRSPEDAKACRAFGKKNIVVFGHPTTSVKKKGSQIFFKVLTNVIRSNTGVRASIIINSAWDACLRKMSHFDVLLGEAKLGVMQLTQVEAAIFKIPVVSLLTSETVALYKKLAGAPPPVVVWKDQVDLEEKLYALVERRDVRVLLGRKMFDYAKKLHDEPAVVKRYLEIVNVKR